MASGSSAGRVGSKGFDFGSDDILCSYEDYGGSGAVPGLNNNNHDSSNSNGAHSDPVPNPAVKDFNRSRMSRSSLYSVTPYSQPDDSFSHEVISIVEKSMKKHTDNVMRFLEGISSRLSQLELYCYNLDKSIGEMRSDLVRDHGEADSKLKSLEKHVQEVHRSVQILRDKQELADAQKELAKLQLAQKESSSSTHSQSGEEKATPTASDPKKSDNPSEANNQQLALALPHQVVPQQQPPPVPPPSQALPQNLTQQQTYYLPPAQLPAQVPAPPAQTQHTQSQYVPSDPQYRTQVQAPQPAQAQVNQTAPAQQYPQYQQQWPQHLPQQVQPPQQSSMQPPIRPPSTTVYPTYPPPGQPATPAPPEALASSMPMQMPYSAIPQPLSSRAESIPYGYGAGRAGPPQPPSQQIKASFGLHPGDGYATGGSHPALPPPPVSAYMMYDSEAGRTHLPPQQSHFSQSGYPPTNLSLQGSQPAPGTNMLGHNPSPTPFMRNHPYGELIDKLVSMGFRSDHVVSVIRRMEESGQPVDFNSVLDRLNVHSSAGGQRGWSG